MSGTIYQHARTFYNALDSRATTEDWQDGVEARVFRGKVAVIYRSLEISQSYYGRVKAGLTETGCLTFVQVGSRGQESVIVLHHPPDEDEFQVRQSRPLTTHLDAAILSQRLDGIESLLGGLNVVDALRNVDARLREQDSRLSQVEREVATLKQTPITPKRRI